MFHCETAYVLSAAGLSSDSVRSRRAEINEAILTDADTRQTTIDRLAAQFDTSRAENEALDTWCAVSGGQSNVAGDPGAPDAQAATVSGRCSLNANATCSHLP